MRALEGAAGAAHVGQCSLDPTDLLPLQLSAAK